MSCISSNKDNSTYLIDCNNKPVNFSSLIKILAKKPKFVKGLLYLFLDIKYLAADYCKYHLFEKSTG